MEPTETTTITGATFEPIIEAITSVLNVDLLIDIVTAVLPYALLFFVFYWGYGFVTRKLASGAKKGRM